MSNVNITIVPVTPFQQNSSIIRCQATGRGAIVDPGGDIDRLLAAAHSADVAIEKILVTHAHIDHAGAVADLAERLQVPIEGPHRDEIYWIERLPDQGAMFGLPAARPFTPDRWLDQGDEITVGESTWQVHHCPGHTPGHVVFFNEAARWAIVGDVLFNGSIGRTDFPKGDHQTLIESIANRLWPLGDDVQFVPGHGPTSSFGAERRSNPFVGDRALFA